jgi:deoxyribonuclease V
MIACVDVDYRKTGAVAACVLFRAWSDGVSAAERIERIPHVEEYVPGQFYRRELPCLLAVLGGLTEAPEIVVVDSYVWLDGAGKPGLGAHLYEALKRTTPVIGVAKTRFASCTIARGVCRGDSHRPLFVTAAGIDVEEAAGHVAKMHGPFRIPTLLKRVDELCRSS